MKFKKYLIIQYLNQYHRAKALCPTYAIFKFYNAWFEAYTGLCLLENKNPEKKIIENKNKILYYFLCNKVHPQKMEKFIITHQKTIDLFLELTKASQVTLRQMDINREKVPFCFAYEDKIYV